MAPKPHTAEGYAGSATERARAALLYLATKLGDLLHDLVVVGGLTPGLLIPRESLPPGRESHVGTLDVDLGLAVALLNDRRYHELCERLRNAGFTPDVNSRGQPTAQRWRVASNLGDATVDFLIPASIPGDRGGTLRNLEAGFAAIVTPGLELAFADRRTVVLEGETLAGERATRAIHVCEAGAFVVLKSLAFRSRGENKDAYDLVYLLTNYGRGPADAADRFRPLRDSSFAREAEAILETDFSSLDSVGARRFAEFLGDPSDDARRADAAAAVREFLRLCRDPARDP